mgnify:CR=1 FL=1
MGDKGLLIELDVRRLQWICASKAMGARYLQCAAASAPLETRVLFSSVGSGLGNVGQAEWATAGEGVGSWIQLGGMGVLIIGTAIYNGSIKVPGLKRETLLAAASPMATSALSRSPLLSRDPIFTPTSPYASGSREPFADAMALGRSNLREGLIGAAQR